MVSPLLIPTSKALFDAYPSIPKLNCTHNSMSDLLEYRVFISKFLNTLSTSSPQARFKSLIDIYNYSKNVHYLRFSRSSQFPSMYYLRLVMAYANIWFIDVCISFSTRSAAQYLSSFLLNRNLEEHLGIYSFYILRMHYGKSIFLKFRVHIYELLSKVTPYIITVQPFPQ